MNTRIASTPEKLDPHEISLFIRNTETNETMQVVHTITHFIPLVPGPSNCASSSRHSSL